MVLSRLIADELNRVESGEPEELDYGKRLEDILDTYTVYPVLDRPVEKRLSRYREELKEEEPSREEYINRLETILEEDQESWL